MRIYTGTGDEGRTGLFSGERVLKYDPRIEAYGDADELVSVLGALEAHLPAEGGEYTEPLREIQSDLLHLSAHLATTQGSPAAEHLKPFDPQAARRLESAIDRMEAHLPPLASFLLPGGHPGAAWAHVARTVCRRVERRVVTLMRREGATEEGGSLAGALVYLNRLSDYLFVLAREINRRSGRPEHRWSP